MWTTRSSVRIRYKIKRHAIPSKIKVPMNGRHQSRWRWTLLFLVGIILLMNAWKRMYYNTLAIHWKYLGKKNKRLKSSSDNTLARKEDCFNFKSTSDNTLAINFLWYFWTTIIWQLIHWPLATHWQEKKDCFISGNILAMHWRYTGKKSSSDNALVIHWPKNILFELMYMGVYPNFSLSVICCIMMPYWPRYLESTSCLAMRPPFFVWLLIGLNLVLYSTNCSDNFTLQCTLFGTRHTLIK